MLVLIRITGRVGKDMDVVETLNRLRLMKKFTCSLVDEKNESLYGMVRKVENFIAFGEIDEKTLEELIKARGLVFGKKNEKVKDPSKIAKEIMAGKKLEDLGIKPFFRLHPARGGINSKKHYPIGVIGNHGKDINKLVMRML